MSHPIELDRPLRDRRATAGSEIVGHFSRESFMRATGSQIVVSDADRARFPARIVHRAMLAAWREKYKSKPQRPADRFAEQEAARRFVYNALGTRADHEVHRYDPGLPGDPELATDAEIRACTRNGSEQ